MTKFWIAIFAVTCAFLAQGKLKKFFFLALLFGFFFLVTYRVVFAIFASFCFPFETIVQAL